MSGRKVCRDCGASKPLEEFSPHSGTRDGRQSYCRVCDSARSVESKRRRRERIGEEAFLAEQREAARRYRAKPEGRARYQARNRAAGRAVQRLKEMYPEEYGRLLSEERVREGLDP